MLADSRARSPGLGSLASGVHAPHTFLLQLVDFIAEHLPRWRDHPDRRAVHSERDLTSQLCAYLNSAARRSLDVVQFTAEVPDSVQRGRSLDVAVQPCGAPIIVMGRSYTLFDILLPIECKRLPPPAGTGRDEREYVTVGDGSTAGGIQRFKLGAHGAAHAMAVMIGYIQEGDAEQWLYRINRWLLEASLADSFWAGEQLTAVAAEAGAVHRFRSIHRREVHGGGRIEIWHLWIALALETP
jgi:hypothetical protein